MGGSALTEFHQYGGIHPRLLRVVVGHKFEEHAVIAPAGTGFLQILLPALAAVGKGMAIVVGWPDQRPMTFVKQVFFIRADRPVVAMNGGEPGKQAFKTGQAVL